jgi:hypothetical protein
LSCLSCLVCGTRASLLYSCTQLLGVVVAGWRQAGGVQVTRKPRRWGYSGSLWRSLQLPCARCSQSLPATRQPALVPARTAPAPGRAAGKSVGRTTAPSAFAAAAASTKARVSAASGRGADPRRRRRLPLRHLCRRRRLPLRHLRRPRPLGAVRPTRGWRSRRTARRQRCGSRAPAKATEASMSAAPT